MKWTNKKTTHLLYLQKWQENIYKNLNIKNQPPFRPSDFNESAPLISASGTWQADADADADRLLSFSI